MKEQILRKINKLRAVENVSKSELSRRMNWSRQYGGRILNGDITPSINCFNRIFKKLGYKTVSIEVERIDPGQQI